MIFHVIMERAEDGWFVVECPALPGCVSQGKDETAPTAECIETDCIGHEVLYFGSNGLYLKIIIITSANNGTFSRESIIQEGTWTVEYEHSVTINSGLRIRPASCIDDRLIYVSNEFDRASLEMATVFENALVSDEWTEVSY